MEGAKRDYKSGAEPDWAVARGSVKDKGGVQSIERAFVILEEVARP
jgi:hypothetical protein